MIESEKGVKVEKVNQNGRTRGEGKGWDLRRAFF